MIVVVGLSHRTAPISIREQLALSSDAVADLLKDLVAADLIVEALAISTCNRVEIVVVPREANRNDSVGRLVRERLTGRAPNLEPHLYTHAGSGAVRHLFRVSSSLDSLVLGEPQILGQVKDAFDLARAAGTVGPTLHRVFARAIRAAKRVRSETSIGTGQVSVPTVAVELAAQIFGDFRKHTAALVGSGEMGEAVARLLKQAGARLIVVGRNEDRVDQIARDLGAEGRPLSELDATLVEADVVVTTTSARGYVTDYDHVVRSRRARKGRNLFFIDLAVPRDVDPRVEQLDGVFLYNIDDLSQVVAQSLHTRTREAERAEQIVAEEARDFDKWIEAEQVTPIIVALRERLRAVLESEIDRSLGGKLRHLPAGDRESLAKMTEAALNKLMHGPTRRLRLLASDNAARPELEQYLSVLTDLFDLAAPVGATATDGAEGESAQGEESTPAEDLPRASGAHSQGR